MSRITIPATIDASPVASQPLLHAVHQQLGTVPNLHRLIGLSPASLDGFLALFGALGKGMLTAQTRNRIALAVAEANGCAYCVAAHTDLGKNLAKLSDDEIAANRAGRSLDGKADAAIRFAAAITHERGQVGAAALDAVRAAGYGDAQVVEIVAHVALNTFTNFMNQVAATDIDFPAVAPLKTA